MTDRELYKNTFSRLHPSKAFTTEELTMNRKPRIIRLNRIVAIAAVIVLALSLMGVAYAADVGGIKEYLETIIIDSGDGPREYNSYRISDYWYYDEEGNFVSSETDPGPDVDCVTVGILKPADADAAG